MFLEFLKAVILGIIQGVTEWLPISSTGHMILANEFINLKVSEEFMKMFLVLIQFGSILAVILLYFKKLNPFGFKKNNIKRKETWLIWLKVIIASIPAAVIGLIFDDKINELFFNYFTVAITLIIYGILFIIIENKNRNIKIRNFSNLNYKTALLIGAFQVLALIPGTSRSGATILGAVVLGSSRFLAAEFSFFLAIPVMFGASFLKVLKHGLNFNLNEIVILLTGSFTAFLVSLIVIKFLMNYIKKRSFKIFGWYRVILGIIILVYFKFFVQN